MLAFDKFDKFIYHFIGVPYLLKSIRSLICLRYELCIVSKGDVYQLQYGHYFIYLTSLYKDKGNSVKLRT